MTTVPPPICFVDTETDGLHHSRQTWEVAIIRRDVEVVDRATGGPDRVVTETRMHAFVAMPSMRTSDPFALGKGKFWDRHPHGRELSRKTSIPGPVVVSAKAVASGIHRITFGAHIVGVNPTFDVENFATMLRAEGLLPMWDYHLEDLVAETAGYCRAITAVDGRLPESCRLPQSTIAAYEEAAALPWKSDQLAAAIGAEPAAPEDRHTAMGDAEWAMRWHDTLTGLKTAGAAA